MPTFPIISIYNLINIPRGDRYRSTNNKLIYFTNCYSYKTFNFYIHNILERTVLFVIELGLSVVDGVSYAVQAGGFCLFGLNMHA